MESLVNHEPGAWGTRLAGMLDVLQNNSREKDHEPASNSSRKVREFQQQNRLGNGWNMQTTRTTQGKLLPKAEAGGAGRGQRKAGSPKVCSPKILPKWSQRSWKSL